MPAAIPIILAITSAVGVGTSLYSMSNQPGAPPAPKPPTPAQNQATATNTRNAQEASISSQFPSLQAQTGGSLSPEAWLQLSQLLSGTAGQPGVGGSVQDLLTKMGGGTTPNSPGLTPGGAFG